MFIKNSINDKKKIKLDNIFNILKNNHKNEIKNNNIINDFYSPVAKLIYSISFVLIGYDVNQYQLIVLNKLLCESVKKNKIPKWDDILADISKPANITTEKKIEFSVLFPIPLQISYWDKFLFKSLKINNVQFKHISYKTAFNKYKSLHERRLENKLFKDLGKITFIEGKEVASNITQEDAFQEVYTKFNLYKHLFNTCYWWDQYSSRMGSIHAYSIITTPPLMIIKNNIQKIDTYYQDNYLANYNPNQGKRYQSLNKNRIKLYRIFKKILQLNQKTEIEIAIIKCVELFGQALDEVDRSQSYINFWRVCEYATQPGQEVNKVITVLKKINPYFHKEEYTTISKDLLGIRNELVHEGKFNHNADFSINCIKEYAEASIQILLFLRKNKFKTYQEVEDFYKLFVRSNKEINSINNIVKVLAKRKK